MNITVKTAILVFISIVFCIASFVTGSFSVNKTVDNNNFNDLKEFNNFFLETIIEEKEFVLTLKNDKANKVLSYVKSNKDKLDEYIEKDSDNKDKYLELMRNISVYEKNFINLFKLNEAFKDLKKRSLQNLKNFKVQVDIISTKLDKNRAKAYINTKEVNSAYSSIAISNEIIKSNMLEIDLILSRDLLLNENEDIFNNKIGLIKNKIKNEIRNLAIVTKSLSDDTFSNYAGYAQTSIDGSIQIIEEMYKNYKAKKTIQITLYELGQSIGNVKINQKRTETVRNTVNKNTAIYIGILSILIISLLAFGTWIILSIKRPASSILEIVKDLDKSDDLSKRIEVKGHDEFSVITGQFNNYLDKINTKIDEITETASALQEDSVNLNNKSMQYIENTDEAVDNTNNVSSSTAQISEKFNSISSTVSEAEMSLNTVAVASEQMISTIVEISDNSDRALNISSTAVKQADTASEKVSNLGEAANEIGKVTEVISEISEQTNLLALNATIEAARAGDAGRGFAVVANEIKVLAKQTADATLQIKKQIAGIQGATQETVNEITQITKTINDVNEIVEGIASAVKEQSTTSSEIASNISNATSGISEINENLIVSSEAASILTEDIKKADTSLSGISSNGVDVKNSVAKVNELSDKLKEQLKSLMGTSDK